MKHAFALALLACAGTSVALAAPRESADLVAINGGPINSNNRVNDAANVTVSATFTGADAGGSYTAQYLDVSGTVSATFGGTWGREAQVLVTPPSGSPFFIQLSNVGGTLPATSLPLTLTGFTVPVSSFSTAGTWTFQFCEVWDDITSTSAPADLTWSAFTVTLNDGTPPAPALGSGPSVTFTNQASDGLGTVASPGTNLTWNQTAPTTGFNAFRITGLNTLTNHSTANTTTDFMSNARVRVQAPGAAPLVFAPFTAGLNNVSTGTANISGPLSGTGIGTWNISLFGLANINTSGPESVWNNLSIELINVPAPAATDLGAIALNGTATATASYTAGQVRWYTFSVADTYSAFTNAAFQIDTEGSTNTNPSLGLYAANGLTRLTDADDGSGSQAQMSFGNDSRPAIGTSLTFSGRDGVLDAGTYFLAVASGNGTFGPLFGVTGAGTNTGDITVNLRSFSPGITPSGTAPTSIDLGTLNGVDPLSAELVFSSTAPAPTTNQWFKLTTTADASAASGFYIDLDSVGTLSNATTPTVNDTEIALYTSSGFRAAEDDDDANSLWSMLTFGANNGRPVIPVTAPAADTSLARDGRDGVLPAGEYYINVADFSATFNPGFAVVAGLDSVLLNLNVRTNMSQPPSGSPCGIADLGSEGGAEGSDSILDNNDFIVFISLFFNNDARADIGGEGGATGSDNNWDNNDFIVFIGAFFDGSTASGCNGNP